LNRAIVAAREATFDLEPALERVYADLFRAVARDAAARFEAAASGGTLTAAATPPGWVPPDPDELIGRGELAERSRRRVDRLHRRALQAALDSIAPELGIAFDISSPLAGGVLARVGTKGANLELAARDVIVRTIEQAYTEGLSVPNAAALLRENIAHLSETTALMQARTDLNGLANGASIAGAQELGIDAPPFKQWLSAGDERVRPTHIEADGQVVPLEQPFLVGDAELFYPGDPDGPDEEVINCRCTVIYSDSAEGEQLAHTLTAAAAHDGVAVLLYPEPEQARALAIEGGEPPERLHITLAYCPGGDADAVTDVARGVAARWQPLDGGISGAGAFDDSGEGGDGFPILALPSVLGLATLRTELVADLEAAGIEVSRNYDFLPHITLDYTPEPSLPENMVDLCGLPLTFRALSVSTSSEERRDLPFAEITAALEKGDDPMPWHKERDHAGCPADRPVAVVKDADGTVEGCHANDADADAQVAALYASEEDEETVELELAEAGTGWRAVLAVEGEATADGRIIDAGALTWRDLPLTLMAMIENSEAGHMGAQVAGRIDTITRDGANIVAEGVFDSGAFGAEVARLVEERTLRGVSVDLAVLEFELRPAESDDEEEADDGGDEEEADDPGLDMLLDDDVVFAVTDGLILGATVCPFPAIGSATIEIRTAEEDGADGLSSVLAAAVGEPVAGRARITLRGFELAGHEVITASALGLTSDAAPIEWFRDPQLRELTPLTITDEGRVYGHVADWAGCHIGYPGRCVPPPRSRSGYSHFLLGEFVTAEGERVPIGQITLGKPHAAIGAGQAHALEHYADTSKVVAYIAVGEDSFGIWCSGALKSDIPVERVRELMAAKLSGDWRNGELIGVLAVNIPGFPIPRPAARFRGADQQPVALVAAGIVDLPSLTPETFRARVTALTTRVIGGREGLLEALRK
jgi:hypothetical protein